MTAESLFTRNLRELARYNRRANARLYDRCAELPDEALREATDAALGSVLALLEHVLAADRVWLVRLRGREVDTTGLHAPTYQKLAPLRSERDAMDDAIESFVDEADEAFLAGTLRSVDSRGGVHQDPVHRLMRDD